jgi:hypothetical protein
MFNDIIDNTKNTIDNLFDKTPSNIKIYNDKYINLLLGNANIFDNINIFNLWNLNRKYIQKNIAYLNLLFPNNVNNNILDITECVYNINYTLEWFIKYLGWEVIDNNIYRLDNINIDWLNSIHYNLIDNMFIFFNKLKMYDNSNLLFLVLCKTSGKYLQNSTGSFQEFDVNKIPLNIFKKWLSYQSFWLNVDNYDNINKIKKNNDIRLFITKNSSNYKTIIEKGTPEDRYKILKLYYNTFILQLLKTPEGNPEGFLKNNTQKLSLQDFVNSIEILPIDCRTTEMYNIYIKLKSITQNN